MDRFDKLIDKHFGVLMSHKAASVQHYLETGKISGTFRMSLRHMLSDACGGECSNDNSDLYLQRVIGSIFDDKIDEWHNSDTPLSLYEYMGLTEEQFKIWLKTPEEIEKHYR